jgi:hypothetical protein
MYREPLLYDKCPERGYVDVLTQWVGLIGNQLMAIDRSINGRLKRRRRT